MKPEKILILDENRGIYIPAKFFEYYSDEQIYYHPMFDAGTLEDIRKDCANPESEFYWEAWQYFCVNAAVTIDGQDYRLEENGDLWGIPIEWRVLSPDGFDIRMDKTYKTITEAQADCHVWLDGIITYQGYYSTADRVHLHREDAYAMCEFVPIVHDDNDEEE